MPTCSSGFPRRYFKRCPPDGYSSLRRFQKMLTQCATLLRYHWNGVVSRSTYCYQMSARLFVRAILRFPVIVGLQLGSDLFSWWRRENVTREVPSLFCQYCKKMDIAVRGRPDSGFRGAYRSRFSICSLKGCITPQNTTGPKGELL